MFASFSCRVISRSSACCSWFCADRRGGDRRSEREERERERGIINDCENREESEEEERERYLEQ